MAALVVWWPELFGGTERRATADRLPGGTGHLDRIAAGHHRRARQPGTRDPRVGGERATVDPARLVRLVGQIRARVPMDKALLNLAAELDDPSADLVIAALILNTKRRG